MNELKNQPIDGRSKRPFYIRCVCAMVLFPLAAVLLCLLLKALADKMGFESHNKRLTIVLLAVMALLLIRYLYRNTIRKWCCAYMNYVYDCMEMEKTDQCPRCNTVYAAQYGDSKGVKECPNKNCAISLAERIPYSKLPATMFGAKALVLNAGVKDDFRPSIARDIWQFIVALIVYAAVSVFCVYFLVPKLIDVAKMIIDLI